MRGLLCVVVHVSRCVLMMSCTRTTIWISGLYTGRAFLITEAGIIASAFGRINSHLSIRTHHGNSRTVAFFPGLDERLKEMRWIYPMARFLCLSLYSLSSSSLPLAVLPSFPLSTQPRFLPLLSSSYLFPSNWADMPPILSPTNLSL